MTLVGCFDSSAGLTNNGSYTYQSAGYCEENCADQDHAIYAMTGGNVCWCGDDAPPKSSKQSDTSSCDTDCVGYPSDVCGGDGYWSVYTSGSVDEVEYYSGSSSSSSSSASSSGSSSSSSSKSTDAASSTTASSTNQVITSIAPGKTVVITQSASSASSTSSADAASSSSSSHHSNTAGIAAGVVVGIVVAAALAAAAFFYFRRRNRKMADEAMSKHQQIPEYSSQRPMAFSKQEGSDARLDHSVLAQRRMSDGSIADNEDYSRRILKVTNPDGR